MSSNFVDYVKIFCRSGSGGSGAISFRREKFVPKGGPDGGDGGKGGSIIFKGNKQLWTLIHIRYRRHLFAENGMSGGGARKSGKDGENIVVEVPLGTIFRDFDTNEIVGEITEDGEEYTLLKGGMGGRGNWHFKTPTKQAPRYAQPGQEGIERTFVAELKVLADVGLVGHPNAGKSTLLSVVSAAKPEIANYPFTTLEPNLGIVEYRDFKSFIMADIPGIIEGAHAGKGLGTRFLRHIERNSILLFMVPADSKDIKEEYEVLLNELSLYNPELVDKKRILAISKSDLLDEELMQEMRAELPKDVETVFISAVSGYNIQQLKDIMWNAIQLEEEESTADAGEFNATAFTEEDE